MGIVFLQFFPVRCVDDQLDLTVFDAVHHVGTTVTDFRDEFGLDAVLGQEPLDEFPVEKWDDVVAINLTSAFHTTRLALPGMRAKNWGRIVNVASVHGLVASANKSAYVAAKHGLVGLTKVTALETAKSRVTCNAICPGWVLTPLVEAQVEARAQHEGTDRESAKESLVAEKQPSGEFVTPDQLARLVLFLCSDAGDQVRGVAWNLDGGWLAQ